MMYNNVSTAYAQENGSVQFPNIHGPQIQPGNKRGKSKQKNTKPIIFNLADTQYEVVERVGEELAWKLQYNDSKMWDIKWNDSAITVEILSKMQTHQKINHFPGMNTLHRKNNLAKNLYRLYDEEMEEYQFFPRTFLLPHDHLRLKNYYQEIKRQGITKTFIVKPEANCQGRGIFLTQDINQIFQYEHCIVQKYVSNPLLYKGLKFDFRVYALVAGCDPLRIYIYNEGLVRFATEKYQFPTQQNMDDLYMHLTNYAINKDSPKYVFNDSLDNLSYGHKKSLAQFFQTLKAMGYKAHQYWSDIKDTIIKTLITGQPHLQHQYRMAQPHNLSNNMCFEILGFDFMIDSNDKVYLLQINHTPSFSTQTPLDQLIKSNLIRDTLILMNINTKTRNQAISQAKQIQQRRVFTGKTNKMSLDERQQKIEQLQKVRDEYQKRNLGSYERIYPSKVRSKQEKYERLIQISRFTYDELTSGNKNRRSPAKFRIKRISTNQSYGEGEQFRDRDRNESNGKKMDQNKSILIRNPHQGMGSLSKRNLPENQQVMHLIQKRLALKTNNEQMTMFSKNSQHSSKHQNSIIPINIHM